MAIFCASLLIKLISNSDGKEQSEENKERDPSFRDCGVGYNHETSKNTRFIRVSVCVA